MEARKLNTYPDPQAEPAPAPRPTDTTGTGRVVRVDENGVAVGPRIPAWAIEGGELTTLSHQALRVYLVLAKYRNNGSRIAYPSQRTITQEAKIKSESLLSNVAELEIAGLVRVLEVGSGKRSTRYQLVNVPDGARTVGPGENIDDDGPETPGPSDSPGKDTKPANGARKRTGNGQSENKGREALGKQDSDTQNDASASLPDASASLSEVSASLPDASASLDSGPKNATNPADTKDCGPTEGENQGIRTNSYRTNYRTTTTRTSAPSARATETDQNKPPESPVVVFNKNGKTEQKPPANYEVVSKLTARMLELKPAWTDNAPELRGEIRELLADYWADDILPKMAQWAKNANKFALIAYHVKQNCVSKQKQEYEKRARLSQRDYCVFPISDVATAEQRQARARQGLALIKANGPVTQRGSLRRRRSGKRQFAYSTGKQAAQTAALQQPA